MTVRTPVVDFHNHVIPGVDDGARDIEESREALEAMRSSGVRALVATPHVDASVASRKDRLDERLRVLDAGWSELVALAAESFPQIDLRRGAEVRLDVPEPDLSHKHLRLDGGRFALVEFPYFTVPPRSTRMIEHLRNAGWAPIIAHPERYQGMAADTGIVREWRAAGAFIQVNGPALIGRYGKDVHDAAMLLIENGWADYLSSDYHARARTGIEVYRDLLTEHAGEARAEMLLWTNPSRLLEGVDPLPVPPLDEQRGIWGRIAAAFR